MSTLVGAALLAISGFVAMRVLRREWSRVNRTMEEQRATSAPKQNETTRLEQDPETGTYRPAED